MTVVRGGHDYRCGESDGHGEGGRARGGRVQSGSRCGDGGRGCHLRLLGRHAAQPGGSCACDLIVSAAEPRGTLSNHQAWLQCRRPLCDRPCACADSPLPLLLRRSEQCPPPTAETVSQKESRRATLRTAHAGRKRRQDALVDSCSCLWRAALANTHASWCVGRGCDTDDDIGLPAPKPVLQATKVYSVLQR